MRRGLVFGKFMPLHRGHELLIDTALAECDDVTIVVYDSDPPGVYRRMPLELRVSWLTELYPQAEQIVAVPDLYRHDPRRTGPELADAYAEQLAFLGVFDRVFTSEPGYEKFAELLGARHRIVDTNRMLVPISGTQIRESLYEHRAWMDPRVYASLQQKVVLVGTESTGKTTLAAMLAAEYQTSYVHEYGRELWTRQGGGTFADHLPMARRQHEREEAARRHARDFLFCDTNAWTTLHWSQHVYGAVDARLAELVDRTVGEYVWVLCSDDFGWVDDGIRELRGEAAGRMQAQQIADLDARGIEYLTVSGTVDRRIAQVKAHLRKIGLGA